MQKDFKEYTVGELIEMGLDIRARSFNNNSKEDGFDFLNKFEGMKKTSNKLTTGGEYVRAWKGKFEIVCFLK